jgi:peptide/nickel transport system substrate-binding protein
MAMLGIGGATSLAGCLGDGDDEDTGDTESTPTATATEEEDVFGDDETPTPTPEEDDKSTPDESPDLPTVGGTYNTRIGGSFTTLNTLYNEEAGAGNAIGYTLDAGYTFDSNNELFPLLYDLNTDDGGNVWVFNLREDLQFSDPYGEVTAETFEYLITQFHQNGAMASPDRSAWVEGGENINIEVTGDYEFQAELPTARFLWPQDQAPNTSPVPQDLIQGYIEEEDVEGLRQDEDLLELTYTGNLGAYKLEQWERDKGTTHVRNENYYLRNLDYGPEAFSNAPYFDTIETELISETSVALEALSAGDLDTNGIPKARVQEFRDNSNVEVLEIPTPFNNAMQPNLRDDGWQTGPGNPMREVEFRQAMATALSKEKMIEQVWRGLAAPHYTWQPRWSEWYPGDDNLTLWGSEEAGQYGKEQAQELAMQAFEKSEFDYGFDGDTMVTPEGDQVQLELYYSQGQSTSEILATFIKQEFAKNLGIEIIAEPIDGGRFQSEYFAGSPEGGTDTIRGEEVTWENPGPFNPGPRNVTTNQAWDLSIIFGFNVSPRNPIGTDVFFDGATASINAHAWYPEFDAAGLYEEARAATNREAVEDVLNELFAELNRTQPYIMLAFDDDTVGYNPDLNGPFEGYNSGWDFPAWYIEE